MKELLFKSTGINKSFGPTHAVADFNFELYRGEVRGLIGENGSGKTTFTSMVAGEQQPDSGTMELKGEPYAPKSMLEANERGIAMVVQEMNTISNITVAANIFAGKENLFANRLGIINIGRMNAAAQEVLESIDAGYIDASANIETLGFEDRKVVEIARAMYSDPDILIVDETTTALPTQGRSIIYNQIKKMVADNKAVIFITHDLDELMDVCSCVTVMRDGKFIANLEKDEMEIHRIRELMVGREFEDNYYRSDWDGSFSDEVVLAMKDVTCGELREFSLDLHKGEILGIAGLSECGIHDVGRAAYGLDKLILGDVVRYPSGERIYSPQTAIKNGIGYISKNRDQEALILDDSIMDNITMPSEKDLEKFGLISPKAEKDLADKEVEEMSIKCTSSKQYVSELSGGNKQKVVFAKWLAKDTEIFILDCPTRGIDIGVKKNMYDLIYAMKQAGKAVLIISEELMELIGMSDRIMVLKEGRLEKIFDRSEDLKEVDIIQYMI